MGNYYKFLLIALLGFISFFSKAQYKTLEFIENKGQWEGPHRFLASSHHENIYLEPTAFTFQLSDPKNNTYMEAIKEGTVKDGTVFKYHNYKIEFLGANTQTQITPDKISGHYYNYFLGNDETKWKSQIHPSRALDYKDLYEGIDMHISSESQSLKYEFWVAPNADASQIQMRYSGQDKLKIKNGSLIIKTSVGNVEETPPYSFQIINGEKKIVNCEYRITNDNKVSFHFPEGYDKNHQLIIDPTVVFATFTGASADNWGFTATYDDSGNFYAGGIVHYILPTNTFPTSVGAYQTVYNGGSTTTGSQYACDMVLFKYNAQGNAYLFATFLGGTDNDQPHSLYVDANNNLVIAGRTYSSNFPVTTGAYDVTHNGAADLVISKLSANGTALLGSTFLGGSGDDAVNEQAQAFVQGVLKHNFGDDARSEVIIDNAGNIYVAAPTSSTNFPVTSNAYQSTNQGGQDGVICKLDSGLTNLIWSTYLGGSSNDAAYVLSLNKQQTHLYVAGGTRSSNFPYTNNTYQTSYQGGTVDGFIGRFLNSGSYTLERMTSIGTNNYDQCYGLQIDNENSVYAMGHTLGGSFPVTSGVYSNPNSSQFIIKLDSMLTTNIYSTVYGSGTSAVTNISPVAFLVDTCQNVYISGWGGSSTIPFPGTGTTANMPITPGAAQSTTDGNDFYFIVLSKNAQSLLYATYMGGNGVAEHVDGGTSRFDKNGVVYQAICGGCGGSSNFPTTSGSISTTNGSANCNLVAVKIAFELGAVEAHAMATPDSTGCAPFTVKFSNGSFNAQSYQWLFGDGGSSSLDTPTHTYQNPGTYTVRMVAYNPNACIERDTVYLTIHVLNTSLTADFTVSKVDSCGPYSANFTNTSTSGSSGTPTYFWDFDDATTSTLQNPPLHVFPDTGCYDVMLIMTEPNACNSPDTVIKQICFSGINIDALFSIKDTLCLGNPVFFTNQSINAQSSFWIFGDGNTSTQNSPNHIYTSPGNYTVTLVITNPAGCKTQDTFTKTVFVSDNNIQADFSFNKIDTCGPFTAGFTNISKYGTTPGAAGFTKFIWDFGDGTTSTQNTPPTHSFPDSGCYDVRLIMIDTTSCNSPDTMLKTLCFNAALVKAAFTMKDSACLNNGVLFSNGSSNAQSVTWEFGDGQTSNAASPIYTYSSPGVYTVKLIARNAYTCNKTDTAIRTILIKPLPKAYFVHDPVIPIANEPLNFTNRSENADYYHWDFGDGTGSSDINPSHLYRKTAQYVVCLAATSNDGCTDTFCRRVDALIVPAIDVPTAFSPNGDSKNDILYVRGAAVASIEFKLYNRWGQLVFETTDINKGWDGTYKGEMQEMESYAYTLSATFFDGTTAYKQGNVTLLR